MYIYFSGIGGVGIGPLAEIALDAGYQVAGSDREANLMTKRLEKRGVSIAYVQDGAALRAQHHEQPIDWFVYTAALPDDHPELMTARQLGITCSKRDELLAQLIKQKNLQLIAVAGTHGKTTTTGMMVWALRQLGIPVSYSIGTTLSWGPSGLFDPKSHYFVYECDEFDRNFLQFEPHLSLVTSIEWDHPDTYPTEADYMDAFRQFMQQSTQTILWQHDANSVQSHEPSAWCLQADEVMNVRIAGQHNRRNATLVFKALERLTIGDDVTRREAIESFGGTERRFEKLADNLYTDYGHTPTEITATLQRARESADHVVLVYQPHQNRRQHEIRSQYVDAVFDDAETVYWLPTYLSRESAELTVLTPEELTSDLRRDNVVLASMDDKLWSAIIDHQRAGHLVLCMGAGSIDGWVRQKLAD